MTMVDVHSSQPAMAAADSRRVLNVGSGAASDRNLHAAFRRERWTETRFDIDASVRPDIVGSLTELERFVSDASFDAIWSSHSLEHLHTHEVIPALRKFRAVLKVDGFALVTCPDLTAVARFMVKHGVEATAYESRVGPIRPLDMIYGHARSIAEGRHFMAHKTGFTVDRLGRVAIEAGFSEVRVMSGTGFDLWAALLMPKSDRRFIAAIFRSTNVEALFAATDSMEDTR